MQRLQLLQKERHQKSIQLYWAEKSGTTKIQVKVYYRKAKLQDISRKSQNPIVEKKREFLVQSIIWYGYPGQHVQQENVKSEIKEAPRSIPCRFVISQLDKFLRFRLPRLLTKQYRLNPRLKNRRLSLYRIYIRGISACRSSHPLRDDARA